jgi:MFS family permease
MNEQVPLQAAAGPWWQAVGRRDWRTWLLAMLGWTFDGYEATALTVVLIPAVTSLLPRTAVHLAPVYASLVVAAALLGWGVGGILGGVVADYVGRKRAMIYAILTYAIFTALTGFATSWQWMAVFRFLTGFGIGSEWGTGTAMIFETWPKRARTMGLVLLQSGFGVGAVLAAVVALAALHTPQGWRWVFYIGVLPALVTLWLRRDMPESARWEQADRHRREVARLRREGRLREQTHEDTFTLAYLFVDPETRRRTLLALAVGTATTVGYWGASTWMPAAMIAHATQLHLKTAPLWGAYTGIIFNLAAIVGYISFAPLADGLGRKKAIALVQVLALLSIPAFFYFGSTGGLGRLIVFAAIAGYFTLGQFSWMTIYLPELYPTRARTTGSGFIFNFTRFFTVVSVLVAGQLIAAFHGYAKAATIIGLIYVIGLAAIGFLPETKGRELEL